MKILRVKDQNGQTTDIPIGIDINSMTEAEVNLKIASAKAELIGVEQDHPNANTVYGAKNYADYILTKPLGRIEMLEQNLSGLDQKIDQTKNEIIGTADDEAEVDTIKGAKQFALDLYSQSEMDNFYLGQNLQNQIDQLRSYSAITSWQEVQSIIRSGQAKAYFSIGEQLVCQRLGETLIWDIIGIDEDIPSDSFYTHSITLQLHNCINISRRFDEPEPDNPQTGGAGFSDWNLSNIRQWLNATEKENWWESTHQYDTRPEYADYPGFLYGIDQDFLSVIGPVDKKTRIPNTDSVVTTSDTMFFLSMTEVGGQPIDYFDGPTYSYYKLPISQYNNEPNPKRIKYAINDTGYTNWWLRSYWRGDDNFLASVAMQGQIIKVAPEAGCYMAPACCIY